MDQHNPNESMPDKRVCLVGSGSWGSAIAKIVGSNVLKPDSKFAKEVFMFVHEEIVNGRKLTEIINTDHENVKYLPGHKLPDNVVAVDDVVKTVHNADVIVFVVPHQFVRGICEQIKGKVKKGAVVLSLIKGLDTNEKGADLITNVIRNMLKIECAVLMGANIASEVAEEKFCEATIGCRDAKVGRLLKELLETSYFRFTVVEDEETVEMCGALKNIVATAVGFCYGLDLGSNTIAAVTRIGLMEMMGLCKALYPGSKQSTFFESCGIADIITTCQSGRNRTVAESFAKTGRPLDELEKELLNGQKLQGPLTAAEVYDMLVKKKIDKDYPLFVSVHKICKGELPAKNLLACLASHPIHK